MNHKKQNLLLAVPLLAALGAVAGLGWLLRRRRMEKTTYAA